jgi:hypothetical protein
VSVYSTLFLAAHDQPAVVPATYTVPAGKLAVVRDLDAYLGTSLSARQIYALGSAGQVFWQASLAINESGWRSWRGRQVIPEGQSFYLFATDVWDLTASGYLLDAL